MVRRGAAGGLVLLALLAGLTAATVGMPDRAPAAPRMIIGPGGSPGSSGPGARRPATRRPPATLFGASVWQDPGESFAQALAREDAEFGRLPIVHVYYRGFPEAWPGEAGLADRPVVVSFNVSPQIVLSGADDAAFARWFDRAPRSHPVYWSYVHEPEKEVQDGKFTAAEYRAAWVHLAAIAARARNPQLHATLILMGYTLTPAAHRNWRSYYPGPRVISVLAWDIYNGRAAEDGYEGPRQMYLAAMLASRSARKPWAIAETATALFGTDGARAAWIQAIARWLHAHDALWVTYFDSDKGGQFELTDPLSEDALRLADSGRLFRRPF